MKVTIESIEALESTGKLRRFAVDGCRWLFIQVSGAPGSTIRSWVFRYRFKKKERTATLGRYPELTIKKAMAKADGYRDDILNGIDPFAQPMPVPPPPKVESATFGEVAAAFMAQYVEKKNRSKTIDWRRRNLDNHLLPVLRDIRVADLTKFKVVQLLDSLMDRPVLQNRVHGLLSKLLSWAASRYPGTPTGLTQGYEKQQEVPRDHRLTEAEIRALGDAYRLNPGPYQTAAIFLLLTGAREGVALWMKREHQFPEEKLLKFPANLDGLKNCRRVFLSSTAVSLLPKMPVVTLHRSLWREWTNLRKKAGIGPTKEDPKAGCSLHDLRRTFGSIGVDLGHDEAVVDALLGHSRGRIRDTYLLRSDPVLAQVAEEIGEHIATLLGLIPAKPSKGTGATDLARTGRRLLLRRIGKIRPESTPGCIFGTPDQDQPPEASPQPPRGSSDWVTVVTIPCEMPPLVVKQKPGLIRSTQVEVEVPK